MNHINTTFSHETLGKLRTVYTKDDLLFCIRDVSRIFGYKDDGKTIRRYCSHVHKLDFGNQTMNFMSAADIDNLFHRGKYANSDKLYKWICDTIIPELVKSDSAEDTELYEECEQYLIHRRDYDRLTYGFALLCHHLVMICDKVKQLPLNCQISDLLDFTSGSMEVCENILKNYGITAEEMKEFDTDRIFAIFDEDVTAPEDGGYMGHEQIVEELIEDITGYLKDWKNTNGRSSEV